MSLFRPLKYITNVTERVKYTNLVRRRDEIFKWARAKYQPQSVRTMISTS